MLIVLVNDEGAGSSPQPCGEPGESYPCFSLALYTQGASLIPVNTLTLLSKDNEHASTTTMKLIKSPAQVLASDARRCQHENVLDRDIENLSKLRRKTDLTDTMLENSFRGAPFKEWNRMCPDIDDKVVVCWDPQIVRRYSRPS